MEALKRYYKERNHSYKPAQEASNKLPKGNTQPPKARSGHEDKFTTEFLDALNKKLETDMDKKNMPVPERIRILGTINPSWHALHQTVLLENYVNNEITLSNLIKSVPGYS